MQHSNAPALPAPVASPICRTWTLRRCWTAATASCGTARTGSCCAVQVFLWASCSTSRLRRAVPTHASSALGRNPDRKQLLAIGLAWTENTRGAAAAPIIGRTTMKYWLDSLWGTVICGLILTLILHNIVSYALGG